MPSTIRGSDNFDSGGGNACKAWVNFNGTGTVAIRAAYNVSSITDNGTGDYTVNFTAALADANYAVNLTGSGNATLPYSEGYVAYPINMAASAVQVIYESHTNTAVDGAIMNLAAFR